MRVSQNKIYHAISLNTPLSIVEPTDTGILADLFQEVIRDGEKRLMLAVLESATEDFKKTSLPPTGAEKRCSKPPKNGSWRPITRPFFPFRISASI